MQLCRHGTGVILRSHIARFLWVALSLVLLAGCASPDMSRVDVALPDDPCCRNAERHPRGLVAVLDTVAPVFGRAVALVRWRTGYLGRHADAQQAILAELRPLDIVLVSNKQRLSGHTIPGLFGHAAIYLGSERQLRDAGLWSAISEQEREAIARGMVFLEADSRGVHLSLARTTLETDRALVLRPTIDGTLRRREALTQFLATLGTPFDFHFDADTPACVFCTELIKRVLPELRLKSHRVYGRNLIFPDEVARAALDGHRRLKPRLYLVGDREGWRIAPAAQARADINAEWRRKQAANHAAPVQASQN